MGDNLRSKQSTLTFLARSPHVQRSGKEGMKALAKRNEAERSSGSRINIRMVDDPPDCMERFRTRKSTHQECCLCNRKVPKQLKQRIHECLCGLVIHRDINAAINILLRAKSTRGHLGSNATGVDASTLVGAILLRQVSMLNVESLLGRECQK